MKRLAYVLCAATLGAAAGMVSSLLLTAFIPACGEDCSSQGLAIATYCLAGGIAVFAGAAAYSSRRSIPSALHSTLGALILAALSVGPSAGVYVMKLRSEYAALKSIAPVQPTTDFLHMAIATRPVQSQSDARYDAAKPLAKIKQWERCLIGTARCDVSPRQAEMLCKTGVVFVTESDWSAFSLIPDEDAAGVASLKNTRFCGD